MRAFKLAGAGVGELQDVEVPSLGETDVLVKVEAAGLCHSDLHLLNQDDTWPFYGTTMGHETAGTVSEVGPGVSQVAVGDRVLVRAIWSCGECRHCRTGRENACSVAGSRTQFPASPGIVVDGGMADYLRSDQRYLTPIGDLDAPLAATLADAGMTPMHAVNSVLDWVDPESVVVIVGVGGLGHVALQILRALGDPPRVVAVDLDEGKRQHALEAGAELALTPDELPEWVSSSLGESGVDVVLDFVGAAATLDLACRVIGSEGAIRIVGLSGGSLSVEATLAGEPLPWGVNVERAYGGTAEDVAQVVALAQEGKVRTSVQTYPLDDVLTALDDLAQGRVAGRAVLVP